MARIASAPARSCRAGRRLFHHPLHASATISGARRCRRSPTESDAFEEAQTAVQARSTGCSRPRASGSRAAPPRARAACCGTTSECRATRPACEGRSSAFRNCARSSGRTCRCPGPQNNLNKNLEYAGRVADYLEFADVLALDALQRTESCGAHFREESQTPDGEALRDDAHFSYVAAWEFTGVGRRRRSTGSRSSSRTSDRPEELQVAGRSEGSSDADQSEACGGRPARQAGRSIHYQLAMSLRTCLSWRCSTSSTKG